MARCYKCRYRDHQQFRGYEGLWICMVPTRREIDNKGHFTYPENHNPAVVICKTPKEDIDNNARKENALKTAKTPVWCYFDVVERSQAEQPGFDPDKQRASLWPDKHVKLVWPDDQISMSNGFGRRRYGGYV
ncbi:MAG: hypothetical protein IJL39_05200 [Clostridia bacterium]|nr:hypothetical protein [Clostridia bacterium]